MCVRGEHVPFVEAGRNAHRLAQARENGGVANMRH